MKPWRRTNIDYVDVGPPADFVKAVTYLRDAVFFGNGHRALNLNVAQHPDLKQLGEFLIAFDMFGPDAGADNCDSETIIHRLRPGGKRIYLETGSSYIIYNIPLNSVTSEIFLLRLLCQIES